MGGPTCGGLLQTDDGPTLAGRLIEGQCSSCRLQSGAASLGGGLSVKVESRPDGHEHGPLRLF